MYSLLCLRDVESNESQISMGIDFGVMISDYRSIAWTE